MRARLHSLNFWFLTLFTFAIVGTSFSLGQWQLRRAAQKEALQSAIEAKYKLAVIDGAELVAMRSRSDVVHRQAELKGIWRPEHTVFLDNRPMRGRTGFVVVTPLMLEGSTQAIWVQRGWGARNFSDRARLPDISTPVGLVTVRGRIAAPPSKLYAFESAERGLIRQNLDVAAFRKETGLPLLDVSLLQTGAASEGLLREWAAPNSGVEKHYGYAFQWFGLCALVLGLYVWFQIILPLCIKQRSS